MKEGGNLIYLIGKDTFEQVYCYSYLGVWADHIENICFKARKLVSMFYRPGLTQIQCSISGASCPYL